MPKKVINNLNAISQIRKSIHCTKNVQFPANLVTFTEEILNGKLHVLCSDWSERCLRLLLNQTDKKSENLSMEVKRFRILALKFFKTLNRLSPKFATYTFIISPTHIIKDTTYVLTIETHQNMETIALEPLGHIYPAGNYMFKVNNRNTRTRCEICSKLTIKTPERR